MQAVDPAVLQWKSSCTYLQKVRFASSTLEDACLIVKQLLWWVWKTTWGDSLFLLLLTRRAITQQPAATCHKHRDAQGFTIFSLVVFGYMPCWENLDHQILCPGHEPQPSDNWWLPDRSTWKRTIQLHSKFRTKQVSITVYSVKNHLVIMLKMSELLVTYFLSDTLQPTNNAKSCSESFHTRQLARPAVVDRICSHQVRQQP